MEQTLSAISASKGRNTSLLKGRKIPFKNRLTKESPIHRNSRLTYEEQMMIVAMLAVYETHNQIKQTMLERTGKTVTTNQLEHYTSYPAWQPKIEKIREEFEAKITDEPISSKHYRIRELDRIYTQFREDGKLKDSMTALVQAREEVEGKASGGLSITQYNQYNALSDEDLRKVIDENSKFLNTIEQRKKQLTIEIKPETSHGA